MLWICCFLACCLPSFHSTLPKALMWVPTNLNVLVNSCLFHKLSKVALFPEVMALTSKYIILKITWNSFEKLECQSYVPTLSPGSFSFSSLCSVFMACKGVFHLTCNRLSLIEIYYLLYFYFIHNMNAQPNCFQKGNMLCHITIQLNPIYRGLTIKPL